MCQAQAAREHLSGDSAVPRDTRAAERVARRHRETPRQLRTHRHRDVEAGRSDLSAQGNILRLHRCHVFLRHS